MKKLAAIAACLAASAAAAPAAAQQPIQLIVNFDGPQLTETLAEIGAEWERRADDNGTPYYVVKFDNNANAIALPSSCRGEQPFTGCTGLRLWANFDKPEHLNLNQIAVRVNEFNLANYATVATYNGEGASQLNMYLVADNGIAIANMRSQLLLYRNTTGQFFQVLYGDREGQPASR